MRAILGGSLALVAAACGGPIDDETPNNLPAPGPGCADCIVEQVEPPTSSEVFVPSPYVAATPQEVTFYSELGAPSSRLPHRVQVVNTTSSTVLMTRAYIVDVETLMQGDSGDASYFAVDAPTLDVPLAPGEDAEVFVTFALSSAQRTALLVIETTHPAYRSLVVSLSGKTFINW